MLLYREPFVVFDEEDDSGGGNGKETTSQTTDGIKKELDAMVESLGGTSTPNVKKEDEIELDLDMQGEDKKVVEEKIFRRILQAQGLDFHVELVWGRPSNSEKNERKGGEDR